MIDEKKLIEELEKLKQEINMPVDIVWNNLLKVCIDTVNEQPNVMEWISCSERLPNTNGVYSVTRKIVDGEHEFYISDSAYFDGQDTWHADNRVNHGREYLKDVIAWMPLQKPYKGD